MDFLQEIISIDKAAAARVEAAVANQKQRTDEFGEKSAQDREQRLADERAENAAFKAEQERLLSEKRAKASEEMERRKRSLDSCFEENGGRWRTEILKRIMQVTEE